MDSVSGNAQQTTSGRLRQLIERHTLTGLADRTGTPASNVHRYANGGRIPAEFCASLVRTLSVNPMWFLLGEGAPYLTDLREHSTTLASDLRDMVDAMNATSRLKLGTLSYRKDLGILRDLTLAASRHEELRAKLGEQVESVATGWLADFRRALDRRELDRAHDLRDALDRLLALTDDRQLHRTFERHCALFAYVEGRREDAVQLQRRNLLLDMAEGNTINEDVLREAFNLCVALSGLGRSLEGRNIAEAILALRGREAPDVPRTRMIRSILAMFELSLGNTERALALVSHANVRHTAPGQMQPQFLMGHVLMRTGAISVRGFLEGFPMGIPLAIEALRMALWREDIQELKFVLGRIGAEMFNGTQIFGPQAKWVLAALSGRKRRPAEEELSAHELRLAQTPVIGEAEVLVLRCQRARLQGDRSARELVLQTEEQIAAIPSEVTLDHLVAGMHFRNVLALAPRRPSLTPLAERARIAMRGYLDQGLGMFREFAEQHGIDY